MAEISGMIASMGDMLKTRPCKYYPNCAKMDDPVHIDQYTHNSVVKRPPVPSLHLSITSSLIVILLQKEPPKERPSSPLGGGAPNPNLQLCGFGEHCKRCGKYRFQY